VKLVKVFKKYTPSNRGMELYARNVMGEFFFFKETILVRQKSAQVKSERGE